MVRTALDEQFGGSGVASVAGVYNIPIASGVPGSKRMHHIDVTDGFGAIAVLPDARNYPHCIGGDPCYVLLCSGLGTLEVRDNDGTAIVTMAVDSSAMLFLTDASTAAGSWVVKTTGTLAVSSSLTTGVEAYTIDLQSGIDVNLRDLCEQQGYAGAAPVYITASLYAASTASIAVIGSSDTSGFALSTGDFPAGSSMLLTLGTGAYICGKGGAGGTGNSTGGPAALDGGDGGAALYLGIDTTLISYGSILGGGGGGGGDTAVAVTGYAPGPGGGGGSGYELSTGGASTNASMAGGAGGLLAPGFAGGTHSGGAFGLGGVGGAHGADGGDPQYGVAVGGSAGDAIHIDSAATLTKQVAGTITGSEVSV